MKPILIALLALVNPSHALAQEGSNERVTIAETNSSMLVKMTSGMSTTSSTVGDRVTGVVIDPVSLRGAEAEGTILRADHGILNFAFDTVRLGGKAYPLQSRILSITSSKGNEGRDDLDQRVRIEGVGIIAFGVSTALDEGAEVRFTAWKK